jgi:hypothetical protein
LEEFYLFLSELKIRSAGPSTAISISAS